MGNDTEDDIGDANRAISRDTESTAPAAKGKLLAGRREELAVSPTGRQKTDGERRLSRATDKDASGRPSGSDA